MIKELNKFELEILDRLSINYPSIKSHIPFLKVGSRENTGVGMYVNFYYINPANELLNLEMTNASISTNETIVIDGLQHGLGYVVDIAEGKILFIELFTYGEEWDGVIPDNFMFTKN